MSTDATLDERHFARLADVARGTRVDWASRQLVGQQAPPYTWQLLAEVVAVRELRLAFDMADVRVVWPQLRTAVTTWSVADAAVITVDLMQLAARWNPSNDATLRLLATGAPVRRLDFEPALNVAIGGFQLAARTAAATASDELAPRRAQRGGSQS